MKLHSSWRASHFFKTNSPRFSLLISHETTPNLINHFLSLLPLCRKTHHLKAFNAVLILHGLIKHDPLIKKFITHCCHLGLPHLSLSSFKAIEKPSLDLQNLLLRSLSDNGFFEDAVLVYKQCRNSGFPSDNYTYPFVFKSCAALRDFWFGRMIHSVVFRSGFGENRVVQTAVLDFYSKLGQMGNARKVFDGIRQPDLVVLNALISGYSLNGDDYKVLQILHDMHARGLKPNPSTFASVFPVCSRFGVNSFGISLHGLAYKLGYTEEESLIPALISMYANCGDLLAARDIFDTSISKNVAIWNAIISAYTRSHKPENAVAVFKTMLMNEVKPNMVTFVSLIPSSENLGSIHSVESFHTHVVKFGFEKEISVITALVSVYAKLGDMYSAESLFRNIRVKNLLFWNSMVSAYSGHGLFEQSLDAFYLMQMDGFFPDLISIISILSSCSELNATLLGKSAHGFSIKRGMNSTLNVSNALLAFYFSVSKLVYSLRIFEGMVVKNIVSWNTMISGSVDNGELEVAMSVFSQMRQCGVSFDLVTLISILPSCHECGNPMLGLAIHGYAFKTALTTDISLANALVSMYINCGELDAAKLIFNDMLHRNVVSWNAILTGYRCHNLQEETIELLIEMIEEDQKPNYVTLLNVLPACHNLLQGKTIHAYIYRRMIPLQTPLLTSLMITYARFENLSTSLNLFHTGDRANISLWNTAMSAHLLSKNGAASFSFFREMLLNKIEPDEITFLNLISSCLHLKNLHLSNSLLAYLLRKGFDRDMAITNSLIDMYAKCGIISTARMLFNELQQKNTVSWSVMINGYGSHGDGEAALTLYSDMRRLGLRPDKVTYMSILSACSHAGRVDKGRMVFDSMIRDNILPGLEHYACMVDLLGRTGHLNEAYEIVRSLPHKPSANIIGSLLGACLSHGNYGLGEVVGRLIMDMGPKDSGPFVILHNIYAAAGKWADASSVRLAMQKGRFSKAPGYSLLDGNTSLR